MDRIWKILSTGGEISTFTPLESHYFSGVTGTDAVARTDATSLYVLGVIETDVHINL